jgi:hypothetical protein
VLPAADETVDRVLRHVEMIIAGVWTPQLDTDAVLVLLEHPNVTLAADHRGTLTQPAVSELAPLGISRICAAERAAAGNSDGPLIPIRVQLP